MGFTNKMAPDVSEGIFFRKLSIMSGFREKGVEKGYKPDLKYSKWRSKKSD